MCVIHVNAFPDLYTSTILRNMSQVAYLNHDTQYHVYQLLPNHAQLPPKYRADFSEILPMHAWLPPRQRETYVQDPYTQMPGQQILRIFAAITWMPTWYLLRIGHNF